MRSGRRALVALVAVVLVAVTWWAVDLHRGERTPGVEITGTDDRPTEGRARDAAEGVLAVEARSRTDLRAGADVPTAQVVHGPGERLESGVVRREGDGWVVEAVVHGRYPSEVGAVGEQAVPWLIAVDPDGGEVLDLAPVPDANG